MIESVDVAGVPIAVVDPEQAASKALQMIQDGASPCSYKFVNAYSMVAASQDWEYLRLLNASSSVNMADGAPLAAVTKRRAGVAHPCHVPGPTFFEHALQLSEGREIRHFFLGGDEMLLQRLVQTISARWPGAAICGYHSPPFRPMSHAERLAQDSAIREAKANFVWVGLGTPRQDREAQRLTDELGIATGAVGAAFDFTAGSKQRAPGWVRGMHLEWVHRLLSEPRRLGKRYFFGNIAFCLLVIADYLKRKI